MWFGRMPKIVSICEGKRMLSCNGQHHIKMPDKKGHDRKIMFKLFRLDKLNIFSIVHEHRQLNTSYKLFISAN